MQKEIDNQNGAYSNLSQTSQNILESLKKENEKDNLQLQLNEINKRWSILRKKSLEIRLIFFFFYLIQFDLILNLVKHF